MKIVLSRKDIKQHGIALARIEDLEHWSKDPYRCLQLVQQSGSSPTVRVNCGHCKNEGPEKDEEAIFRRHLDAAIKEAISFWMKRAGLEE